MVRKTREERGKENVAKERNVTDLGKARRGRNLRGNVEKEKIAIHLKIRRKVVKAKRGRKQ